MHLLSEMGDKWCSGVKDSLRKVSSSFVCNSCTSGRQTLAMTDNNEQLDISGGVLIEKVDKFCYLQ